jgi:hypothetical protein
MSFRYTPVEVICTLEELSSLCAEWQERLRLQDWDIRLKIQRGREMHYDNNDGECRRIPELKIAYVYLNDPVDYDGHWPYDMEVTLVHELMHIHWNYCISDRDSAEYHLMEAAIECTAQALVTAKRGANAANA